MVCFTRVTEPVVGKQYIYYNYLNLDILGTYLENGNFEYFENINNPSNLYELCAENIDTSIINDSLISVEEVERHILYVNSQIEMQMRGYENINARFLTMAKFELKPARAVAPVDPRLLRLRDMLKKI